MYPYQPATTPPLPTAELTTLLSLIPGAGGTLKTPEDLRCANVVLDYGSAVMFPVPVVGAPAGATGGRGARGQKLASCPEPEVAGHLRRLASGSLSQAEVEALPWATIMALLMAAIKAYFGV